MTSRFPFEETATASVGRWTLGLTFAAALHVGIVAASLVDWRTDDEPDAIEGAILVELAPLPVAAAADAADVAPVAPTPEMTPPAETPPPAPVEDMAKVEEAPLAPAPEVTLPPPPPEPVRDPEPAKEPPKEPVAEAKPEQKPEPQAKPEPDKAEEAPPPVPTAAPQVAAPTALMAPPAPVTAAPKEGMSATDQAAKASWQGKLALHVNRHQRYPAEARNKRIGGETKVGFTVDRQGKVLATRVVKSSGSSVLDEAAVAMIERASPLPVPPDSAHGEKFELVLPVRFRVR